MTFDPFGIQLGPLYVRYYALIMILGVLVGACVASWDVRRRGQDPEFVWDLLVWAVVGGVAGARLWSILTPSPSASAAGYTTFYFLSHPWEALAVWKGGVSVIGAVPGGLLGVYLYTRRHPIDFVAFTDTIAVSLPLGQAIGRWGNFVNQELHGTPTTLPWGIRVAHPLPSYSPDQRLHPVFLYESLGTLLIGLALIHVGRRWTKWLLKGDLFLLYLMAYPALRFTLEFLKPDLSQVFGLNADQSLMVLVALAAALALAWRHLRPPAPGSWGVATADGSPGPSAP
jgi:phosphatidylglycerol:prolipoprotein diacylglycerol transferase